MAAPYLIDEMTVDGQRLVFRANPGFRSRFLRDDFTVEYPPEVRLESLDDAVLVIPFVLSVLPLIWRSGRTYRVRRMDEGAAASLGPIREAFRRVYADQSWNGALLVDETVPGSAVSSASPPKVAVLFSGGVDSIHSSTMHRKTSQLLVTLLGMTGRYRCDKASARQAAEDYFRTMAQVLGHRCTFVHSNFGELVAAEKLVGVWPRPRRWLVEVQHGLGFLGLLAPVMRAEGIEDLLMAGCELDFLKLPSASHPTILDATRWSGGRVRLDGAERRRQQKVRDLVSQDDISPLQLRPCLQPTSGFRNCGLCSKCLQTSLALRAEGEDPQEFGFEMPSRPAISTLKGLLETDRLLLPDVGELHQWKDIQTALRSFSESPRWKDQLKASEAADLFWFLGFDLERYYEQIHRGLKSRMRGVRRKVGLLIDRWPAFGRRIRALLRPARR